MEIWIIPLILVAIALLVILIVLGRIIPRLLLIDVATIPKERTKQIKEQLIMKRFARMRNQKLGRVNRAAQGAVKEASRLGRRAVQKLYRLEQQYKKLQQAAESHQHTLNPNAIKKLLDDAEELVRQEEYIPAEKKYIEIISHNPKNISAYEGLGNLYVRDKKFDQARETIGFALKISPDDASLHMSMAELEEALGNPLAELEHLRKCVELRPKDPKYLDAYLEAALQAKSVEDASKALDGIREVNPENSKIPQWEKRLKDLMGVLTSQEE